MHHNENNDFRHFLVFDKVLNFTLFMRNKVTPASIIILIATIIWGPASLLCGMFFFTFEVKLCVLPNVNLRCFDCFLLFCRKIVHKSVVVIIPTDTNRVSFVIFYKKTLMSWKRCQGLIGAKNFIKLATHYKRHSLIDFFKALEPCNRHLTSFVLLVSHLVNKINS